MDRHYSCCGALSGLGNDAPHICHESGPIGTALSPTPFIPLAPIAESRNRA
jgi:hypothetical protein